jgi:hypothetical protein
MVFVEIVRRGPGREHSISPSSGKAVADEGWQAIKHAIIGFAVKG